MTATDNVVDRRNRIAALGFDYASQPQEPVTRCNLCGADDWVVLAEIDRYGYPARTTACNRCALVVLNPRMTVEGYRRFYESVYRPLVSAYHGRRIDAQTIQEEQRVYGIQMADLLAEEVEPEQLAGGRMLDAGGSTGVVSVAFAKRFGLKPTVLDPSQEELACARERGFETIASLIEDWDPTPGAYQLVGLFKTVDHLLDVQSALSKLRRAVAAEGLLIMDIVDLDAVSQRDGSLVGALKIDHPHSLTQQTTEVFLARTGFKVLRKSQPPGGIHVAYICEPVEPDPAACPTPEWVEAYLCDQTKGTA